MAYVDVDKFAEAICDFQAIDDDAANAMILLLRTFPTADVAPKSEVAKEIKTLENKVGKIYNHYVFEDTDYADDDVAIEAVINALTEVLNEISDLKNKYTEGENENS